MLAASSACAYAVPALVQSLLAISGDTRDFVVDATFDIVDVYDATDTTACRRGLPRIHQRLRPCVREQRLRQRPVGDHYGGSGGQRRPRRLLGSPTSNLFRGMVVITNDTDQLRGDNPPIYAQDGDTLTLQVFDENGNRSSNVLATATALIDNSPPTISDLDPADESVISDDSLRISFNVNDDGAGADFRNIEKVVTMVQVQARADIRRRAQGARANKCTAGGR